MWLFLLVRSIWLFLLVGSVRASDVTDEQYSQFPRLYHLDDYEACLARSEGLYCLGKFQLRPATRPHRVYDLMKEYSLDPHNFDRTHLHRGYCVSSRCPGILVQERNASLRFERCAERWARGRNLSAALAELSYCRSHAQELARASGSEPLDVSQKAFLWAVGLLLLLNALGTAYDALVGRDVKRNQKLMCWSVPNNWRRLIATYEEGDPRLAALNPIQGIRVLLMALIILSHAACIQDMLYLYNPRWIEQVARHPVLMLFLNGSSVVQLFVMLSGFLLSYNLLLVSKKQRLTINVLPYIIAKRVAKTWPLQMLVVGFAATWWPRTGTGPMWSPAVATESQVCRDKFWTHALYVNNLVNPDNICLVQTWFMAVDFQLYAVAAAVSLWLVPRRQRAVPVLGSLVVVACALNGAMAHLFEWKSLMYYVYPKTLHDMFKGIASFSSLYISPWGSLPVSLLGLLAGHLYFDLQEAGINIAEYRSVGSWRATGSGGFTGPWFTAFHVALDRPIVGLLGCLFVFGMIIGVDSFPRRVFSWRGWHALARLSLAAAMGHWGLNLAIAAARPQPLYASTLGVIVDFLATTVLTYLLAVPLTVMVEIPVQQFASSFLYLNKPVE